MISMKNSNFDMFPTLKITYPVHEIEAIKNLINDHLTGLWKHFSFYFENLNMSKHEWIRNPIVVENNYDFGLIRAEYEMMIDLTSDSTLKQIFEVENEIATFLEGRFSYIDKKGCGNFIAICDVLSM